MTAWRSMSLYWRLLISYLLVVAVASLTLYVASEALAPTLFDWHLEHAGWRGIMIMPHGAMLDLEQALGGAHARAMQQAVLWGVLASTIVAGALSLFIAGRITSPLRQMQRASRRIAAGRYHERLAVATADEIGDLASAFNEMAGSLADTERRRLELLANVAHEFRTPLTSLQGYLEGIADGTFDASPETIAACGRQVRRLEHLVDDLSLLSRVETGQERLAPEATDVGRLLDQAAAGVLPQFAAKRITLDVEHPRAPLVVRADPQRTGQVLGNLLSNALRHTPEGGAVRLRAQTDEASGAEALVEVIDDGDGIPPDAIAHVFTRFYRGDKARGRDGGSGSGIGLTIAKHIVEAQGGRIGVDSDVGRGSSFWFTLPLVDA
ncbi:MAG: HAMP domain-containing histidine kinase [Trueperaceae bacterium]|nr:HAMP domain-containing histidine kinase [Trueperaceae bacterium]